MGVKSFFEVLVEIILACVGQSEPLFHKNFFIEVNQ
jgi:hypothetical protein